MNLPIFLSDTGKRRGYFSCLLHSCWPRHVRDTLQSAESACQALRRIRRRHGLTQAETAELLGTSAATVQAWEAGRRNPSGAVRMLIQLTELTLKLSADACAASGKRGNLRMSDEHVPAGNVPESLDASFDEQGCKAEIVESVRTLSAVGAALRQNPVTDYAVAVVAQEIESLRRVADDLDRQYAANVKKRKIKFKDRVAYLAVRERVASRIVDFVEDLRRLRSTDAPTEAPESDWSGGVSWNPDDDGRAALSQAMQ